MIDRRQAASWYSIFEGMGVRPEKYAMQIDNLDYGLLEGKLNEMETVISNFVETLPTHEQFLRDRFSAI